MDTVEYGVLVVLKLVLVCKCVLHVPCSFQVRVWPAVGSLVPRLQDSGFLVSDVCSLLGKDGLGTVAGFLEGGAGACPLVGGSVSWASGGQGCVQWHGLKWLWAQEDFSQPVS